MKKFIKLNVKDINNYSRVDNYLSIKLDDLSRNRIKNLILDEKLKINNLVVKSPSKKIFPDDKIILEIPDPKKASLKPYDFKLDIVYEDQELLVLNKPSNIWMHRNI